VLAGIRLDAVLDYPVLQQRREIGIRRFWAIFQKRTFLRRHRPETANERR
jgi:hypothetical protein